MIIKSKLDPLDYDDVLLVPEHSYIKSRKDVNIFITNKKYMPIFSAPMKGISNVPFIKELSKLGGIGILHRFFSTEAERLESIIQLKVTKNYGISIGINQWKKELVFVKLAVENGAKFICIDTATGHMQRTIDSVYLLNEYRKENNFNFEIISGNVATYEGSYHLAQAGSDFIRVGIGGGSVCSTRNATSVGVPDLTAIQDCSSIKNLYPNVKIIADGGIKNSGNAIKAFVFGADYVMIGSLFGKSKESNNGGIVHGMSSYKLQNEMGKHLKSNEGLVIQIPQEEIRPLKEIYEEFTWGIKSGLSYLDCSDINELHNQEVTYIKTGNGTLKKL